MKYTLTIASDNPSELAKLLAMLTGSTAAIAVSGGQMPSPPTTTDDDESGDTVAQNGTLDADGLPHDPRIHSETPTLTTKGVWRKRRGVSDAEVTAVEAELRARTAAATTAAPQPVPPMPTPMFDAGTPAPQPVPAMPTPAPQPVPPMPTPAPQPAPVAPQPVPPMPTPAPQPAPVAPAAPAPMPTDFNGFMQHISGMLQQRDAAGNPLVDAPYLSSVAARVGQAFNVQLNAITDISANAQMITYAVQLMQADGRWR